MLTTLHVENAADLVSEESRPLRSRRSDDYPSNVRVFIWGDFGTSGVVKLEVKMPDGTFQEFPELTFEGATAQTMEFFEEAVLRFNIADCVSVSAMAIV